MENDALTSTFTRMRQRLLSMAERITGNRDDAADAVQDAFCRLWQKRADIDTRQAAEGMSVVSVKNASIDQIRRQSAHRTEPLTEQHNAIRTDSPPERSELFNEVKAIIETELSETQRTIMQMREFEGRSFEEIAERLGLEPVNVRVQLSRARKKIREIYRKHQENDR